MTFRSLSLVAVLFPMWVTAQRLSVNIDSWEFSRDQQHWQQVSVPHDWAIAGPFDKKWDLQYVAITQNGETEKSEKSGRSGALPWIGHGYYRTHINGSKLKGKRVVLAFDGAMSEPHVFVNGKEAGWWAYGYNAFNIDITRFVQSGDNLIEVNLNNLEESSRWYPGGGIYRPVHLIATSPTAIDDWSVFCRTLSANDKAAVVEVSASLTDGSRRSLSYKLTDSKGHVVASAKGEGDVSLHVSNPQLWSPDHPYLYTLTVEYKEKDRIVDSYSLKTGIRTLTIGRNGVWLNGKPFEIKGVCLHHDLGPLGAAVNKAAIIRQVKILKDMGANAIRTSHNMPSQTQMQVYDSLGMVVMAESFDMWVYAKCQNGYARFFKDWADKDIKNLVLANRNHPSLIMYSIGNEIPEQWSEEGREIARHLQDICHQYDSTRTVTQGMDRAEDALKSGFAQVMDVPGFNYRVWKYPADIKQLPCGFLLGSETASTVSSRGVYKFPVVWGSDITYPDGQCNGYDTQWCSWSNLPEEDFMAQSDAPYTIGQFVWTGFDYLGEPTPYDSYWPSRSSYFGICDLAGLPKDRYYLYRSVWNTKDNTVHVLPHWTWPGREGQSTPVFVYTNYPSAELFINGKSQGRRTKSNITDGEFNTGRPSTLADAQRRAARYRLMWDNVKYEPGELRVVCYDSAGNPVAETSEHTADKACAIKLEADRDAIKADGNDLAYITVSLTDQNGYELPTDDDELQFEVRGAGIFRAACNGDATSLESFAKPQMKLFSGKLVVTLQATKQKGDIILKVKDITNPSLSGEIKLKAE